MSKPDTDVRFPAKLKCPVLQGFGGLSSHGFQYHAVLKDRVLNWQGAYACSTIPCRPPARFAGLLLARCLRWARSTIACLISACVNSRCFFLPGERFWHLWLARRDASGRAPCRSGGYRAVPASPARPAARGPAACARRPRPGRFPRAGRTACRAAHGRPPGFRCARPDTPTRRYNGRSACGCSGVSSSR